LHLPEIIQGGMGVAISTWRLAKTVSMEECLGVVSGTGLGMILISRLMEGDPDGYFRRALGHFPFQESVQRILDRFYVPSGIPDNQPYKRSAMWTIKPPKALNELTVVANFVEIFLAKEGHDNPVGINLLEKVQMPNMTSLYGAMLAGVDFVIMGAGIPMQIPGILDRLADHQAVSYRLDVSGASQDDDYRIHFDPEAIFPGVFEKLGTLKRPLFLPIVSSVVLAKALLKRATGKIDGFVVEAPTAGGHNAPPRGPLHLNAEGEPIYGGKDEVDLEKIKKLGLPFWLAGGYGNPARFQEALDVGAVGIQVGTGFAYCDESAMSEDAKKRIICKALRGEAAVRTDPIVSPTGFPFKVVQLEGTLSEKDVYAARVRVCDVGFLRQLFKQEDGSLGYRCPAEPVEQYVKKGGGLEDTVDRGCLCNSLAAIAGFAQRRQDGSVELMLVTSGDSLENIRQFIKPGETRYSAHDVIDYLTGRVAAR
jgi:nitronate monooxygenase